MKVLIYNLGPSLYKHFINAVNTRDPLQMQISDSKLYFINDNFTKIETNIIVHNKIIETISKENWYYYNTNKGF